jgi:hypothetical protein
MRYNRPPIMEFEEPKILSLCKDYDSEGFYLLTQGGVVKYYHISNGKVIDYPIKKGFIRISNITAGCFLLHGYINCTL